MSEEPLANLPPIAKALSEIPAGAHGAAFLIATTDGVTVGAEARWGKGWTLEVDAGWHRSSKTVVSVELKKVW